jgi:hypothetical protein
MMVARRRVYPWQGRVGNGSQIGGIELSTLNDGLGRGVRIAWVNTGTGLRYKVVLDRAMDIVDAFYNEHSLAWLSFSGVTPPAPDPTHSLEWLDRFPGGLMTTCGLSHVGAPGDGVDGRRHGLHGPISSTPAAVTEVKQPDPVCGDLTFRIRGEMLVGPVFGPHFLLRRTISGELGEAQIHVEDEVRNCGNMPVPHMMLYHCNLGWPLVDQGAELLWNGACTSRGGPMDDAIFASRHNYRRCPPPLVTHSGGGEACGFINVKGDRSGRAHCGVLNRGLGLGLGISFKRKQLPWLTNWQHWGPGEYVTGLEPGTNPPIGQVAARDAKELIRIKPGDSKTYELSFAVYATRASIKEWLIRAEFDR